MGEDKVLTESDIEAIKALIAQKCDCAFTPEEVFRIKGILKVFDATKAEVLKKVIWAIMFGIGFIIYLAYNVKGVVK